MMTTITKESPTRSHHAPRNNSNASATIPLLPVSSHAQAATGAASKSALNNSSNHFSTQNASTTTTSTASAVHPTSLALFKNMNAQQSIKSTNAIANLSTATDIMSKISLSYVPNMLNTIAMPYR